MPAAIRAECSSAGSAIPAVVPRRAGQRRPVRDGVTARGGVPARGLLCDSLKSSLMSVVDDTVMQEDSTASPRRATDGPADSGPGIFRGWAGEMGETGGEEVVIAASAVSTLSRRPLLLETPVDVGLCRRDAHASIARRLGLRGPEQCRAGGCQGLWLRSATTLWYSVTIAGRSKKF